MHKGVVSLLFNTLKVRLAPLALACYFCISIIIPKMFLLSSSTQNLHKVSEIIQVFSGVVINAVVLLLIHSVRMNHDHVWFGARCQ